MKIIIYKTEGNGVAVITPSDEYLVDHTMEELAAKDVPSGAEHYIVDASILPAGRNYRNAWEIQNGMVKVNQTKASQMDAESEAKETLRQSMISKLATTLTPEETALLEELL